MVHAVTYVSVTIPMLSAHLLTNLGPAFQQVFLLSGTPRPAVPMQPQQFTSVDYEEIAWHSAISLDACECQRIKSYRVGLYTSLCL